MSQLNLEIKCGIDRTEISRIERGLVNISFYNIVRLLEALDADINVVSIISKD